MNALTTGSQRRAMRIGTAGWSLRKELLDRFAPDGTHLERYSRRFSCVEINSSFYRPHRSSTYERWARSVPEDFTFSLKVPKTITHERRLAGCDTELERFLTESAGLERKRAVLLVQLPPSFAWSDARAGAFFEALRARYGGGVACEPRHDSWFSESADALLTSFEVARVAADPAPAGRAVEPGGWGGLTYYRLHGKPRIYYSTYDETALAGFAAVIREPPGPTWCIFDNTALGAATVNALRLAEIVDA